MTWTEQRIRDRFLPLCDQRPHCDAAETKLLLDELDRARDALKRIRAQAEDHIEKRVPGYGRWETTLRIINEVEGR